MNERRFTSQEVSADQSKVFVDDEGKPYPDHVAYFFEPFVEIGTRIIAGEHIPRGELLKLIDDAGQRVERNTASGSKNMSPEQQRNVDLLYHSALKGLISNLSEQVDNLANDELTGATVRKVLMQRVMSVFNEISTLRSSESARESTSKYMAIALIDLDCMKILNESYGYDSGDKALAEVCSRVTESMGAQLRQGDVVARIGGDEFVVMISGSIDKTDPSSTMERVMELFRHKIDQALTGIIITLKDGSEFKVKASVGFSHLTSDDEITDFLELKARSEEEMKVNKHRNKKGEE